jgi:hypothetical protein
MMIDDDECGAIGGMFGSETWNTRRKPAMMQLCSLQIPYIMTRDRTRDAAVGTQRLSVWVTPHSRLCRHSQEFGFTAELKKSN